MSKLINASIELSFRKEKKGYTIYLHNHTGKTISGRSWVKGKKNAEKFPNRRNTFDTDNFGVKHAGWYTVLIEYEDHEQVVAQLKIKKSHILIIIIPLIAAIAAGSGLYYLNHHSFAKSTASSSRHPDDLGSADNGAVGTSSGKTAPRNRVIVSSAIIAKSGAAGTEATWYFEDPKTDKQGNSNNVIEQAEVYVSGQLVAESPALKPGDHITLIKLLKTVPAGVTTTKTVVNLYSNDTKKDFLISSVWPVKMDITSQAGSGN